MDFFQVPTPEDFSGWLTAIVVGLGGGAIAIWKIISVVKVDKRNEANAKKQDSFVDRLLERIKTLESSIETIRNENVDLKLQIAAERTKVHMAEEKVKLFDLQLKSQQKIVEELREEIEELKKGPSSPIVDAFSA